MASTLRGASTSSSRGAASSSSSSRVSSRAVATGEVSDATAAPDSEFEIAFRKPDGGRGLGIKVDGNSVVCKIAAGGVVAVDGRMRLGDKILSVNEIALHDGALAEALQRLDDEHDKDSGQTLVYRLRLCHTSAVGSTAERLQTPH